MNMKFTNLLVAAPLALAAFAAWGQTRPPSPPPDQHNPPVGNHPDDTNRDAGAATPFDSLDASHQGYLTRQDAAADSWLASHFAQCDADRDGRVTRPEYTACSRAKP
ncbi:MAG TPA: hypothetical protein VJ722_12565 [Rhodanobacteraceae bacterium]|nr:hypothetical protein [Rhodanobacteraceae bacterium]